MTLATKGGRGRQTDARSMAVSSTTRVQFLWKSGFVVAGIGVSQSRAVESEVGLTLTHQRTSRLCNIEHTRTFSTERFEISQTKKIFGRSNRREKRRVLRETITRRVAW